MVFDKTGTLTAGKPVVTAVTPLLPFPPSSPSSLGAADAVVDEAVLLRLAAAVERSTTHPVAQALVRAADELPPPPRGGQEAAANWAVAPGTFVQEPGSGVRGEVGGREVVVGTLEWLARHGAALTAEQERALAAAEEARRRPQRQRQQGEVAEEEGAGGQALGVGNSHSRVYVAVGSKVAGAVDVQVCRRRRRCVNRWLFRSPGRARQAASRGARTEVKLLPGCAPRLPVWRLPNAGLVAPRRARDGGGAAVHGRARHHAVGRQARCGARGGARRGHWRARRVRRRQAGG